MRSFFRLVVLTLAIAAVSPLTWAGGAIELKDLLDPISDMQGEFNQVIKDKQQAVVQESAGAFKVKRPGFFHWQTAAPFEQVVVGTPEKVWVYDPDLEQVTINKQDLKSQDNPMSLLSGTVTDIESRYEVTSSNEKGLDIFELSPKKASDTFALIKFMFKGTQLQEIRFKDKLDQTTSIQISKLSMNQSIPDKTFLFEIPPGTDVVTND